MLPFLKPKNDAVVMSSMDDDDDDGEHSMGIMSAAEDLMNAVHAKDTKGVADALKAHYDMREAEEDDFLSQDEE